MKKNKKTGITPVVKKRKKITNENSPLFNNCGNHLEEGGDTHINKNEVDKIRKNFFSNQL